MSVPTGMTGLEIHDCSLVQNKWFFWRTTKVVRLACPQDNHFFGLQWFLIVKYAQIIIYFESNSKEKKIRTLKVKRKFPPSRVLIVGLLIIHVSVALRISCGTKFGFIGHSQDSTFNWKQNTIYYYWHF